MILMSIHNIYFYGEIRKIISWLSPNTHLFCSAGTQNTVVISSEDVSKSPDQTAPEAAEGAAWSAFTLFAILSVSFGCIIWGAFKKYAEKFCNIETGCLF